MESLFNELMEIQRNKRLPPVNQWQPAAQGTIDIKICADGSWLHEGEPIRRANMVALFSTILRLDDQGYALVTPAERLAIRVEDKPFLAVDMLVHRVENSPINSGATADLLFTTNVGDHVLASVAHPLHNNEPMPGGGPPVPCVTVRDGLEARLSRPAYYRLVEHALAASSSEDRLIVSSGGTQFDLGSLH